MADFSAPTRTTLAEHDSPGQASNPVDFGGRKFDEAVDVAPMTIKAVGITTEKPVIAAVAGWCVGGALVMVMTCDLVVAADNTKFSYPEARLGFTGGMIAGLAGRIPHHAAMDLILLGRPLGAERAHALGFVNDVVTKGRQVEAALAMARDLAGSSPMVLKTLKRFVVDHVLAQGPSERMARTQRDLATVRESEDAREGIAAFREKRAPRYQGR
jgi:enoyl-CoA hydratase/carnithine racemase